MKIKIRYLALGWSFLSLAGIAKGQEKSKSVLVEHEFNKTSQIRVEAVSSDIIRVSIVPKGVEFGQSGLDQYGFITPVVQEIAKPRITKTGQGVAIKTGKLGVKINYATGSIEVTEGDSEKVLLHHVGTSFKDGVTEATFKADKGEDWIGFGDQARTHLCHRGRIADCDISTVEIGKSSGTFEGRTWSVIMHLPEKPVKVSFNSTVLNETEYKFDDQRKELTVVKLTEAGVLSI